MSISTAHETVSSLASSSTTLSLVVSSLRALSFIPLYGFVWVMLLSFLQLMFVLVSSS